MFTAPELFRYNAIVSVPFFIVGVLASLKNIQNFSFTLHPISRSIHLLPPNKQRLYRANFVIKAFIDVGFVWYMLDTYHLSLISMYSAIWMMSLVSFALMGYFTEEKGLLIHKVSVYTTITLMIMGQLASVGLIHHTFFSYITWVAVGIECITAYGFLLLHKTNAYVQVLHGVTYYIWLVLFVMRFLPSL